MPMFNGPMVIDPPTAPQQPYGLFDVVMGPMSFPNPDAQGGGVLYVPDDCNSAVSIIDMTCPPITGAKTFGAVEAPISGAPFAVMSSYICTPIGFDFNEAERRVRLRLALREQRAVEQRLWSGSTGVLGTVPGLFAAAQPVGAVACTREAVALLEQTLADNAVIGGIIHARAGVSALLHADLVRQNGRMKVTPLGTPYVFGQGYSGVGPSGQAVTATTEWMYASGRVLVWRDAEVFVPPGGQVLNKSTNQLTLIAERTYAVAVECGIWAVQVGHSCTAES